MSAQSISSCVVIMVITEMCAVVVVLMVVTVAVLAMVTIPLIDAVAVTMRVACVCLHISLLGHWLLPKVVKQPRLSMGTPSSGVISALLLAGLPPTHTQSTPAHTPTLPPPRAS